MNTGIHEEGTAERGLRHIDVSRGEPVTVQDRCSEDGSDPQSERGSPAAVHPRGSSLRSLRVDPLAQLAFSGKSWGKGRFE